MSSEPTVSDTLTPRQQAREWYVRLQAHRTPADRKAFKAWLYADPAHVEAYRQVEATWGQSGAAAAELAQRESAGLDVYLKRIRKARGQSQTARRLSALCLALLAVLGAGIWLETPGVFDRFSADHWTARGERRTFTLPDGSTALLDADSAVATEFTQGERRVRLLRGRAYFDVRKTGAPFVVKSDAGAVQVLGTRFSVAVFGDEGVATLETGAVQVTAAGNGAADAAVRRARLSPGEEIRFGRDQLGPVERIDVGEAFAWRGGRFVFYRARLSDVIAEVGRYRLGRIVLTSAALGRERVTGSFSLDDPAAALASLQTSVGFTTTSIGGRLLIISP